MNILSLFDGMSCGQLAINRLGLSYDNYFASEVDKYAIKVTMANFKNTIQIGDVREVKASLFSDTPITLMMGGSPCQSFSFAGKRKGMSTNDNIEILSLDQYLELKEYNYEFEGQSYLFWEYIRLLNEVKPKYFLLENVMMEDRWEKVITKTIGVHPLDINSSLLSAQNRRRLYWTNIGLEPKGLFGDLEQTIGQPKEKGILLKDILEKDIDEKYYLSERIIEGFLKHNKRHIEEKNHSGFIWKPTNGNKKAKTLRAHSALCPTDNSIICHSTQKKKNMIRRLTPVECERLQTVPDNYTNFVSDTQRYKMLGNGWTIDVISHILKHMK